MLDLFGDTSNQGASLAEFTGHQIAVNNARAIRYKAGCAHYIGDESRTNRCRELNNSFVSKRLLHGLPHRPQFS
jgi:hypothetical protein